jgi:fido (protein-threonine AMPylation protein)
VTFDPFGDFETCGYLRNVEKEKDPDIVRRLQHTAFTLGLDAAFKHLAARKRLEYSDVLKTHQTLFEAFYPWAGQDRLQTAPGLIVKKGNYGDSAFNRLAPPRCRCVYCRLDKCTVTVIPDTTRPVPPRKNIPVPF